MDDKLPRLKKKEKTDLTTAQVSSFLRLTYTTLYAYTRIFPEFFSPGAQRHTSTRRWTQEDLEMVWAIRSLKFEHTGNDKIRELLAGGWKIQNVSLWTKELMAFLLEESLASKAEMERAAQEVITLKKVLEERQINNEKFKEMWIQLQDLQHEFTTMQKAWRLRTVIVKAVKKKYHGEPPDLYHLQKT